MVVVIVYPDYMRPGEGRGRDKEGRYSIGYYEELLQYVESRDNYWHAIRQDVAEWWRKRDTSEVGFDKDGESYIKRSAAKDGVIRWYDL